MLLISDEPEEFKMEKIYVDNGATSFPKPKEVADAVYEYMTKCGTNINRGGYELAYDLEGTVFETREMLGLQECRFYQEYN